MKTFLTLFVLLFSSSVVADYIMIQTYYNTEHDTIGVAHWDEYGKRFANYQQCESSLITLYKDSSNDYGKFVIRKSWEEKINVVIYRSDGSIQVNFNCIELLDN